MRQVTLMNLAASHMGSRNGVKSEFKNFINHGCITSPAKSLDLLRRNLQSAINKDIDCVIKKYLEVFIMCFFSVVCVLHMVFHPELEIFSTCCQ